MKSPPSESNCSGAVGGSGAAAVEADKHSNCGGGGDGTARKAGVSAEKDGRTTGAKWEALTGDQLLRKLADLEYVEHFLGVNPSPERPKNLEFGDMPVLYDTYESLSMHAETIRSDVFERWVCEFEVLKTKQNLKHAANHGPSSMRPIIGPSSTAAFRICRQVARLSSDLPAGLERPAGAADAEPEEQTAQSVGQPAARQAGEASPRDQGQSIALTWTSSQALQWQGGSSAGAGDGDRDPSPLGNRGAREERGLGGDAAGGAREERG
ncbi:hypothetical protein CYMTET_36492, partial [Cymbomonas tetramitiformis]